MTDVTKLVCSVCRENEALGVAASPLAPVSLSYCRRCLDHGADAEFLFQWAFDGVGGDVSELAPWVLAMKVFRDGEYISVEEWASTAKISP